MSLNIQTATDFLEIGYSAKTQCGDPIIRSGHQAFTRFEVTFAHQGWGVYAPPILKKIKKGGK